MKKYFKIILITIFLISLAGCSSGDNFSGKINIKEEMPEYIEYIRKYEQTDTYMINDDDDIKEIVDSIKNVKVGEKTDKQVDDYSDILRIHYENDEIVLNFEEEMLVDEINNERYTTKGLDNLRSALTKATKNLGETECCAVEEETTVELFEVEMILESKAYEIFNVDLFNPMCYNGF